MIIILAMGIGLFAASVWSRLLCGLRHRARGPGRGIRAIWGYLLALMAGLIIVAIFPWISIGFL